MILSAANFILFEFYASIDRAFLFKSTLWSIFSGIAVKILEDMASPCRTYLVTGNSGAFLE